MAGGKHAYLIMAHGQESLLQKLISALDDPRNDIFVHMDSKVRGFDPSRFSCSHSKLTFIERQSLHWGGPSLVFCEVRLLKAATQAGVYDYYHLLSGCDLPIKSQDYIHAFFDEHAGTEYVSFWKMHKSTWSRFLYAPLGEYGHNFLANFFNNICKGIQMGLGIKRNADVDFRYGSQWFSITDGLARLVVSKEDWIHKVFHHTCLCDEVFLQTITAGSEFYSKCASVEEGDGFSFASTMRFIDWTRNTSHRHPYVFRNDDYELLTGLPWLFARKFDERVDSQIVQRILSFIGR